MKLFYSSLVSASGRDHYRWTYFFKTLLIGLISSQLILAPWGSINGTPAQANSGDLPFYTEGYTPGQKELIARLNEIENSDFSNPVEAPNVALLKNQGRLIWDSQGDAAERRFGIDISLPQAGFIDYETQLETEFDPEQKRLYFHLIKNRKGQKIRLHSHFIGDIEVTGPVVMDPHLVLIPTQEGLRAIPMSILKSEGFNHPVPCFLLAPPPHPDSTIVEASFTEVRNHPRQYADFDGSDVPKELNGGDIGMTVLDHEGKEHQIWINRDVAFDHLTARWIGIILMLELAAPDDENRETVRKFFRSWSEMVEAEKQRVIATFNQKENELLMSAVVAMGQRSGVHRQIDALSSSLRENNRHVRRDRFASSVNQDGEWFQTYRYIESRLAEIEANDGDLPSWQEIAVEKYLAELPKKPEALPSQTRLRGKLFGMVSGLWNRVKTPRGVIALSAALGGIVASGRFFAPEDSLLSDASVWFTRSAASAWHVLTTSPYNPEAVREALLGLPNFIERGGDVAMLAVGASLLTSAYLLTHLVFHFSSGVKRKLSADGFKESARRLLQHMKNGYLVVNRALEVPWLLLRQKNLYPAIENNVPLTQKGVWNSPLASQLKLAENVETINLSQQKATALREVAGRIAGATLVAEETGIDVATLLQNEILLRSEMVDFLSRRSESPEIDEALDTQWALLSTRVHEAAVEILRLDDLQIDQGRIQIDVEHYRKIAEHVQRNSTPDGEAKLARRYAHSCAMGARNFSLFMLGKTARDLYARARPADLSPKASSIAYNQGLTDFTASQLLWFPVAPDDFSWIPDGRIAASTVEQVFGWMGQNPIDVAASLAAEEAHNVYGPIGAGTFYEKDKARKASVVTAMATVLDLASDPSKGADSGKARDYSGPLEAWGRYIINLKEGIWVRTLTVMIPLFLLEFGPDPEHGFLNPFTLYAAFSTAIYILMSKMGGRLVSGDEISPGTQLVMGYAFVWPFATSYTAMAQSLPDENKSILASAAASIYDGVRLEDQVSLVRGVVAIKQLYRQGGAELPEELNIESTRYDAELGLRLLAHTRDHKPVPDAHSSLFEHIVNIGIGSFISVILYNSAQRTLIDRDGASLLELGYMVGMLFGSYYVIKGASNLIFKPILEVVRPKIIQPIKNAVGSSYRHCVQVLSGRDPVNTE